MSTKNQPKRKPQQEPKVAILLDRYVYLLCKDPNQKKHLVPMPPEEEYGNRPYLTLSYLPFDTVIVHMERPYKKKLLKKAEVSAKNEAFIALWRMKDAIEDSAVMAKFMLIGLLSRTLDLALPKLPKLPAVQMKSIPYIPEVLHELLCVFCGPEEWQSEKNEKFDWWLNRPHCLEAVIPLGNIAPSMDLQQYIGGQLSIIRKPKPFWLPYQCTTVVFAGNLPESVTKSMVDWSPLIVPCFCGNTLSKNRAVIELDGKAFFTIDSQLVDQLKKHLEIAQNETEAFIRWIGKHKEQQSEWFRDIDMFRPFKRIGRFEQMETSPEKEIWAVALALLKRYLYFASDRRNWISREEANDILMAYWKLVLPESCPKQNEQTRLPYDRSETFYGFLTEAFLPTYSRQIVLPGQTVTSGMVGKIHELRGQLYFTTPRTIFLEAYHKYMASRDGCGFQEDSSYSEAAVQKQLQAKGVPLKGESGNSTTWRHGFYPENRDSKGEIEKIPCFGLPLAQLPQDVQDAFCRLFGIELGGENG